MPDGTFYDQASNLYSLEKKLATIPLESFLFHSRHNDFSRWFYTLAEVELASQVRPLRDSTYDTVEEHRRQLIRHHQRKTHCPTTRHHRQLWTGTATILTPTFPRPATAPWAARPEDWPFFRPFCIATANS